MDNKNVFAFNLRKQMEIHGKTRNDICKALDISYFTVSDWVNGKKYPRMDKVEMLANYFGILKSDLIEDKEENKNSPDQIKLTEGEERLLESYRKLSSKSQKLLVESIDSLEDLSEEKQTLALQLLHFSLGNQ